MIGLEATSTDPPKKITAERSTGMGVVVGSAAAGAGIGALVGGVKGAALGAVVGSALGLIAAPTRLAVTFEGADAPPGAVGDPRPEAERSPGILYPWLPEFWTHTGTHLPERYCLGVECWNLRRLSFFEAGAIVEAIKSHSPPISEASLAAVALYDQGYFDQARAVHRLYGEAGVEHFNEQIRRTYDGSYFQPR